MHTADTTTSGNDVVIQDDAEVLIDSEDPSTYTLRETAADTATALINCDTEDR
jgi:hypothetical protein